ncbi:MAG: hypothetical protein HUJ62_04390, partial [Streptococcus gallolyticus]|nr:hypothetical protein [Streptococcus gallolyticus]
VKLNKKDVVRIADVLDVSSYIDESGVLSWKPQTGIWKIIRYGHTPTGVMPHPVDSYANGLECDKMSREAMEVHFNNYVEKIIKSAGNQINAIKSVVLDSYEAGAQTWTSGFREKFIDKRGYDPLFWLPCFGKGETRKSGNSSSDWIEPMGSLVVESEDLSARFRSDYLQTIEDLVLEGNILALSSLTKNHTGIKFCLQPYNAPYNFVSGGMIADYVSGEFWHNKSDYGWWTLPLAASVAHLAGTPVVSAEAFTATPLSANWDILPEDMKAEADLAFSKGVNSFQMHVMPHQPWSDEIFPGMISQSWGVQLNRHNPIWKKTVDWIGYITRVQSMLREGNSVEDVVCLYPSFQKGLLQLNGYKCDAIDEKTLLNSMSADETGLVLETGRRYKLLVLPESKSMKPEVLKRIADLVSRGACVLGLPPSHSPSLTNYPQCDSIVSVLVDEIWGTCEGDSKQMHRYGKGCVFSGYSVEETLQELRIYKDFESISPNPAIVWCHRRLDETDIYFVANQSQKEQCVPLTFRVSGMMPELWDAQKKTINIAEDWENNGTTTTVNIDFEPLQSYFVVFRVKTSERKSERKNRCEVIATKPLSGEWTVSFHPVGNGEKFNVTIPKPKDFTLFNDERIKYFSGNAIYSTSIFLAQSELVKSTGVIIDLGKVGGIASLKVNGKFVGNLWKAPYKKDILSYLSKGENHIEIEVTNTLTNCLIGDEQKPCDMELAEDHNYRRLVEYPKWLYRGEQRESGRKTFT